MANVAKYLMGDSPNLKKVYLIRHGATSLNRDNNDGSVDRIRGWKDVPLSPEGREQAEKVANKLKGKKIDVLYHSTLSRAADTAQAIAGTTGAKLIPTDKLKPWDMGELTGQESKDVHPVMKEYAVDRPDDPLPGGESFNNFKNRAFSGLKEILANANGQQVGMVTHHRVERLIKSWIKEGQPSDLSLDMDEMLKHGEATGHAELVHFEPHKLGLLSNEERPHIARKLISATG